LSLPKQNRKIMIGVSGGLDSTHALIIAKQAFLKLNLPLEDIYAVIMPSTVSSESSSIDAKSLIEGLGLKSTVIDIKDTLNQHLNDINHNEKDTTFENAQARIRTLILMNLANKYQGFVLGTGDLSEIALGFMTYNGDQMSMYAINAGLPKTLIQALIRYYAENEYIDIKDVLLKIVNKPISPELLENQKTEDIIGSYQINDFIMYYHLETGLAEEALIWLVEKTFKITFEEAKIYVERFINLFYKQQFKRTTLPEGPKVFDISLSPRNSYKMPSDIVRK
ncbi:MAG TPA: NAD(+) synthase, partial [Acholeplasmataceae bacterium]|nr:NAD(+) synthase [Acholeplasmataceae bacterium]